MPSPPSPPVPIPDGQSVVWSYASSVLPFVGNSLMGTAGTTKATNGFVTQFASGPLSNSNESVTWSNWVLPNELTRPGCQVHAIYPVFQADYQVFHTVCTLHLLDIIQSGTPWNGSGFGVGSNTWSANAGTDLSVMNKTIVLGMGQTLPQTFPTDSIFGTFVAVAIYIDKIPAPSVLIGITNDEFTNVGG
jgi:hypothetical protein